MEQYIKKSALVAEIERRISEYENCGITNTAINAKIIALQGLLIYIKAFEVKEVDLEKELIEWHKKHFKKDGTFIGMSGFYLTNNSQMDIAKHFFELGLKAQKEEKV